MLPDSIFARKIHATATSAVQTYTPDTLPCRTMTSMKRAHRHIVGKSPNICSDKAATSSVVMQTSQRPLNARKIVTVAKIVNDDRIKNIVREQILFISRYIETPISYLGPRE